MVTTRDRTNVPMKWGLRLKSLVINARSDTKSARFRSLMKSFGNRCIVKSKGYFEWKMMERKKQPYFIKADKEFNMAGLWSKDIDDQEAFVIMTCEGASQIEHIHDRMPVIIPDDKVQDWLEGKDIQRLLVPFEKGYSAFPVSNLVNDLKIKSEAIVEPIKLKKMPQQSKLVFEGGHLSTLGMKRKSVIAETDDIKVKREKLKGS